MYCTNGRQRTSHITCGGCDEKKRRSSLVTLRKLLLYIATRPTGCFRCYKYVQYLMRVPTSSSQDSLGLFTRDGNRRVIKPERIIIVRHGESLGNLDESVS